MNARTADDLPRLDIVRHGETEWSRAGRHTGLTDVPLTLRGEAQAAGVGRALAGRRFALVFTSPLVRAARTCEVAGRGDGAIVDPDLVEWDYGGYEGRRTVDIRAERPDWELFRDGCPGGETLAGIGARADRVVARVRAAEGDVLMFSSGHFLRVLAARWLGLEPGAGRFLRLDTATLGALGYEKDTEHPVIRLWNAPVDPA